MNLEVGKWSSAVSWDLFPEMNDNSRVSLVDTSGEKQKQSSYHMWRVDNSCLSDWKKLDQDNMKLRFSVVQGSITVNVK